MNRHNQIINKNCKNLIYFNCPSKCLVFWLAPTLNYLTKYKLIIYVIIQGCFS